MSASFQLRFPVTQIQHWASRYEDDDTPVLNLVGGVKQRGYLTKDEFLIVCRWKTARTQKRCRTNSAEFIREVSRCALSSNEDRFRIEVLRLLDGVDWPTASVMLHFFHDDAYPILDFRALWSLESAVPRRYDFQFWPEYTDFCRSLSITSNVSMRALDQALWQFSNEHQK